MKIEPFSGGNRPIRFLLGGRLVEVADEPPTTTVLDFLRKRARRTGTKEGCAEGDCGACTVVIGSLEANGLQLQAVNACIQFLPTLDGKALFTVEDVQSPDGSLHPVQKAMVDCHASQCGFCTPGFVMSLWACYHEADAAGHLIRKSSEAEIRRAISGNLCRCTGYRPIIEAGLHMQHMPRAGFDRSAIEVALRKLSGDVPLAYAFGGQRFFAPRTLKELTDCRLELPEATLLAGGTDIGLWANKKLQHIGDLIYTGAIEELKSISTTATGMCIGAAATLTETWRAMQPVFPELDEVWERFASTPVRNAGTLGGNIANGSPIGDSMPALIALGASVQLASQAGLRDVPLEDLYIGYQQKSMAANEVVSGIRIPLRPTGLKLACYKLSKRFDSDISAVCAAFALMLDGDTVLQCRIALGGMAEIPKRALATERCLAGASWSEATIQRAMAILAEEFSPLTDARASKAYRLRASQNLLHRFYLETRLENPVSPAQLRVFA